MTLAYKKFLKDPISLESGGFISEMTDKHDAHFFNKHMLCEEANTILKVVYNEEGYFDFNKAILDIGAFVGAYSCFTPFEYVYAFEPNYNNFCIMNVNLIMNDKQHKTFNVLLSDKKETLLFDGFNTNISGKEYSFYVSDYFDKDASVEVETHIIDEYNLDDIGFIKIDVEGMEEKVLRGALGTIIRNDYPPILFELWTPDSNYMTEWKYNSCISFIESLGYTILYNWGDKQTHLAIKK